MGDIISAIGLLGLIGFLFWIVDMLTSNNCEGVGHLPTEFTDETGHFLCERCCQWVGSPGQGLNMHGN